MSNVIDFCRERARRLQTPRLDFLEEGAKRAVIHNVLTWEEGKGMVVLDVVELAGILSEVFDELCPEHQDLCKGWHGLFLHPPEEEWAEEWAAVLEVAEHHKDQWLPRQRKGD